VTLVVVPAIFGYVDRFREWVEGYFRLNKEGMKYLNKKDHSSDITHH
jgi:HAE1 family hydrophobic/amphiphilic exporter-1